jgi:pilus assembly protein Flp/PilA
LALRYSVTIECGSLGINHIKAHLRWVTRSPNPGVVVRKTVKRFLRDESGATAIEYGLIAAGIAVAIIAVISGLGTKLKATFSAVSTAL